MVAGKHDLPNIPNFCETELISAMNSGHKDQDKIIFIHFPSQ